MTTDQGSKPLESSASEAYAQNYENGSSQRTTSTHDPDIDEETTKLPYEKHDELNPEDLSPHTSAEFYSDQTSKPEEGRNRSPNANKSENKEDVTVVSFPPGDKENPYNWTLARKTYISTTCITLVMNSTIGSSLPAGNSSETRRYFNLHNDELLVLPISMYLMGYVMGPLVFAPLSEFYGRKWVLFGTFALYTAFTLGCALAPTFAGLVIMRLISGVGASTPISVIGGVFADIYKTPKTRGMAVTVFMVATTWGPLVGPIISGFVSVVTWRWAYWVSLIIAGATFPFVLFMPETYGPVLLKRKAQRLRKQSGNLNIAAPMEMVEQSWLEFFIVVLLRPIRMFLFEWIVLFSCLYTAVAYAIFYIFFEAYPIIYQGIYGFNAGEEGLAFVPIGIGAIIAGAIYIWWEHYLGRVRARASPPAWALREESYRLPLGCLGAPLFAISLFWLGWTARSDIHWIVPTLSAIPFGLGFLLIFMSLINYIVDAYEIYAASGMGAASCSRSIFGVVLPFAAGPMYAKLDVAWACSLLGFVSILMGVVPFLFIKYGAQIRANSKWCQELKRKKAEDLEKTQRLHKVQEGTGDPLNDTEKQL